MKVPFSYVFRNLWTRKLTTMLTAGGMGLVVFVFAGIAQGVVNGDVGGMLRRIALELPMSVLGMVGLVTITQLLIRVTDELSGAMLSNFQDDVAEFGQVVGTLAFMQGQHATAFVVFLFGFIVVRGLISARSNADPFCRMTGAGLVMLFGLQSFINMAVNLNLIPPKGMTLPFLSYGGSSLLSIAITTGLLLAVTRKRPKAALVERMAVPHGDRRHAGSLAAGSLAAGASPTDFLHGRPGHA